MFRYLIRRVLWAMVLFVAVTIVTYVIFFIIPADPARAYYAIVSKSAEGRKEVAEFVSWLKQEAAKK